MTLAILGLLSGLLSLALLWARRKKEPTVSERKDDLEREFTGSGGVIEKIHKLRAAGNHAEADALLRRYELSVGVRKPQQPPGAVSPDNP